MKTAQTLHNRENSFRPFGALAFCFSFFAVMLITASACLATPVTLAWDPSPDADLDGYRIYQSDTPGSYSFGSNSPNLAAILPAGTERCTIAVEGGTKFFVGTAVDSSGNESLPSNEVSWVAEGWSDYRLSLRFRSDDNDAIGAMFRYQDKYNYYRFSWNAESGYRRLVKRERGVFKVLAEDAVPYQSRRIYDLDIVADGADIKVFIDGAVVLSATDKPSRGTVALYSWQNDRSYFTYPEVVEIGTGKTLLTGDFTGGAGPEWQMVDEGTHGGAADYTSYKFALLQQSNSHTPLTGKKDVGHLGTYALYFPDPDGDGVADYMESVYGSDGMDADTDGDGFSDGVEAWWKSDPVDSFSTPAPLGWENYTFEADLGSLDDDGLGVMFRYRDADNFYRFTWNRQDGYRRLERCVNGTFSELYGDTVAYDVRTKYHLRITVDGNHITVEIDGNAIDVYDGAITAGGVALYSYGSKGACFDNITVSEVSGGVVLEEDFNDKTADGWKIHDQGLTSYPSRWIFKKGLYVQYSDIATPPAHGHDIAGYGTYSFFTGN